jgi:hypothetical protein
MDWGAGGGLGRGEEENLGAGEDQEPAAGGLEGSSAWLSGAAERMSSAYRGQGTPEPPAYWL